MAVINFVIDDDGQMQLTPDVLLYSSFRAIYEADPSPDHFMAFEDLKWIRFMNEEDGPFSDYDAMERLSHVNLEVYNTITPQLDKARLERRKKGEEQFVFFEETTEGGMIQMLRGRVRRMRQVMQESEKKMAKLKPDELAEFTQQSIAEGEALAKLLKTINDINAQIERQGGKKKVNNKAGAQTTPNESGRFSLDNIEKRRKSKDQNQENPELREA